MNSEFEKLTNIVKEAGEILRYYFDNYDKVSIVTKQDNSPVTTADLAVNDFLQAKLESFRLPVVSEETTGVEVGKNYFLLDPLDGTRQFIKKKPNFCISLAIVMNNVPKAGIIYAPILDEIYAFDGENLYTNQEIASSDRLSAVISRSTDQDFVNFYDSIGVKEIFNVKAAIKYGRMAIGMGDINIRKFPISSWDIAAGYAMLKAKGFDFLGIDYKELDFSKPYDEINGVIVIGPKAMKFKEKIQEAIEAHN